jgi:hypothetical protein
MTVRYTRLAPEHNEAAVEKLATLQDEVTNLVTRL